MTLTAKQEAFLQIKQLSVDDLIPYAKNSRTHSAEQVAQIAASIREFGFTNPVLIDSEGGIIAGHGRVQAARKLGMAEVPCIMLDNLTELQKQAYIIADNKLALNAGWDDELLKIEFAELKEQGFDLELTGFTLGEIDALGIDDEPTNNAASESSAGKLSDRFMIPPFSVMNAREGWWQNRKKAWLALGIKSELGRGGADMGQLATDHQRRVKPLSGQAAPGGSARPACDYSKKQRGNGAGRPING